MENRKTGQTTRQINMYIKNMIDNPGQSYQIVDHYNDVHNNSIMVKRIEHRLQNEYPNMIDVYHRMDNYGVTATGTNTMSVRYSPYVLLDRDIFIGRVVDEVIESLFHNMNKPVDILEIAQHVHKDNPKTSFPTLNNDFCNKVIKHTLDRFKYEHGISNIDNCLSSEYNVSKESLISISNRYFIMKLYSPEFLEAKLSLKVDVDNLDVFKDAYKEYNGVIDTCVTKDISSDVSGNDWIKLSSDGNLITNISNNICVGSIDTDCNSVIDKFEELEKMVEELKNKDKYKMPDVKTKYDEFNLFK